VKRRKGRLRTAIANSSMALMSARNFIYYVLEIVDRMNGCNEGLNFLSSLFALLQCQCQWRSFLSSLPDCLYVVSVLVL